MALSGVPSLGRILYLRSRKDFFSFGARKPTNLLAMKLKDNRILKYGLILLFSIEFLAPAVIAPLSGYEAKFDSFRNPSRTFNLTLTLFAEENDGEERDASYSHEIILINNYLADNIFREFNSPTIVLSQEVYSRTAPPLFRLHCTYLI
jgi:hypothetical protein